MLIHKDMKMAEVIYLNHHLLQIINRFGIQLGFGDKTVEMVCHSYKVETRFFLEIVNTYHDSDYFPLKNLRKFKAGMLIDYLQKTHQHFLDVKIPEIEQFIQNLLQNHSQNIENSSVLSGFFQQYKNELTSHILREEQRVYPYVRQLEKLLAIKNPSQDEIDALTSYSIHEYETEHEDVEEKLFDLKNIIIKHLPSPSDSTPFNRILHDLFELEIDLNNHARIENLILVPIVEKMERTLQSNVTKTKLS